MSIRVHGGRAEDSIRQGPATIRRREQRRVDAYLRAHPHRTAAGLLGLFVLAYLWPALLGLGVLSPASHLFGVPPWSAFRPPDGIQHYNPLLSDFATSYYPWDTIGRRLLHSGTFPAWNPYALAGTPLFANPGIGWLGPFMLPVWVLPLSYALGLAASLKLWTAAFGAYLLVRELRLGFWPGILAGVSFALCAFNVVWLSHGAQVAVAVWLPWLVLLAERIVRRGGSRVDGLALAVVAALVLAGGHPGTEVHVLAGTLLYAFVRAATLDGVPWSARLRALGVLLGALALGALAMAVVLIPGELASAGTMGRAVRMHGGTDALIGHVLSPSTLRTALFPDWWGRPSEGFTSGPANYNERTFYAGGVALLLAVTALVSPRRRRAMAPFLPLGALGIAVPLKAPLIHAAVVHLPAFSHIQNQRLLLWFAFAVAILGAFGLQGLLDGPMRQARAWAVLAAGALAGIAAIATLRLAPGDPGQALHQLTDRFAGETAGALAMASSLRWLLVVGGLGVGLALLRRLPRRPSLAGGAVALLAAVDMLAFAHAYQPVGPAATTLPQRTPAIAFLQQHAAEGRIAGVQDAVMNDYGAVFGLRDVRGHDVPQPSLRFLRLWRLIRPDQDMLRGLAVTAPTPLGLKVLGLLGARYVVAAPGVTVPPDAGFQALAPVYRGRDATIFENGLATPRALVARRVIAVDREADEYAAVTRPAFDARRDVIVRRDELGHATPAGAAPGDTVTVVRERNAGVELKAHLRHGGVVLLDDAWAPGWSVTVDGRPARALRADVVMRGVVVPAGQHRIEWRYRVPGLRAGALLSLLGVAVMLAWGGAIVRGRRRRMLQGA